MRRGPKIKEEVLGIAKLRKYNMKLYKFYIMFGYDMLFYYVIKVLYFSQVKNISDASIVSLSTIYALTSILFLIISTAINTKIGNKKTLILGNFINIISIIIFITGNGFEQILIGQILNAIAFSMKNISFGPILSESIPKTKNKGEIFSKIDGNAFSKFCIFSAIATVLAGFLYDIDCNIPMYLCLTCAIIAAILSTRFKEIEKSKHKEKNSKEYLIKYINKLKDGFIFTIKSGRIKALLLSLGFIFAIITLFSTYQMTLLKNIGVSAGIIGLISMLQTILKGQGGKFANKYNEKYKNKSLTSMSLVIAIIFITMGIISTINIDFKIKVLIITVLSVVLSLVEGLYNILYKKYLNNFTNTKILPTIYSVDNIYCNFERVIIYSIGSFVLTIFSVNYGFIIMGVLFIIIALILQLYMKSRVGLTVEEYKKEDLKYFEK